MVNGPIDGVWMINSAENTEEINVSLKVSHEPKLAPPSWETRWSQSVLLHFCSAGSYSSHRSEPKTLPRSVAKFSACESSSTVLHSLTRRVFFSGVSYLFYHVTLYSSLKTHSSTVRSGHWISCRGRSQPLVESVTSRNTDH